MSGGGKGDDKKVPKIDPKLLIQEAIKANRVGVSTPYGSQLYSTDANGNAILNTTLTPQMQAILQQQMARASAPASHYTLPGQHATTLHGLNTRLDQRYGMGLPPATPSPPPGSSGPGGTPPGTTPPIGSPGGLPPSTPPGTGPGGGGSTVGNPIGGGQGTVLHRGDWPGGMGIGGGTGYGGAILAGQQPSLPYGGGANAGQFGLPLPGYGTGATFNDNYGGGENAAGFGLPPPTGENKGGGYLGSGTYSGMGQGLAAAGASSGGGQGFGWGTIKNVADHPITNVAASAVPYGNLILKIIRATLSDK